MGNQTSAAVRKKNGLSFHKDTKEDSSAGTQESLSRQSTLKPNSKRGSRFGKSNFPVQDSESSASSTSTAVSPSARPVKAVETTGTDGASTPKIEPYRLDLPSGTVSPSETSTITQGVLGRARTQQPSAPPPMTPEPSLGSPSRPSSSFASSESRSSGQPMSPSGSLHSLFPRKPRPGKVPAPPLLPIHLECYQSHRQLLASQNVFHPVPCMICGSDNKQVRWKCIWCCVRICGECSEALIKIKGRDLGTLVKMIKGKGRQAASCEEEVNVDTEPQGEDSDTGDDSAPPSPSPEART
ncbi:MAG: hypothetical protein LQ345_002618 [Seirophora villosa]|nr:MAG: hypothetical protein LQ345_002618 [Seirophora villosa]